MNKKTPSAVQPIQWQLNEFNQPIGPTLNWRTADRPSAPIISGQRTKLLRLSADSHAAALFAAFGGENQPQLWTYMGYGPFTATDAYKQWAKTVEQQHDPFFYCITDKQENPKGLFALSAIAPTKGSIELSNIVFSSQLQHSALATEAVYLALNYVFELGYRRCEWKCNALNEKSKRAALRFGFSYEGLFRNHMVVKGRSRDSTWFGMTIDDWKTLKPCYEIWLQSENFDKNGDQQKSLSQLTKQHLRALSNNPLGTNCEQADL